MSDSVPVPAMPSPDGSPLEDVRDGAIPQVIIYELILAGRVYIGKHEVNRQRHDAHAWPEAGVGRLPDRYAGSGRDWKRHVAEHSVSGIQWAIIDILDNVTPAEVEAEERCAIAAARGVWGEPCINVHDGGGGLTSEAARALALDPEWRANQAESMRALALDPVWRAKNAGANRALALDPEWRANMEELWADPEFRARNAEAVRAKTHTPEIRAKRGASISKAARQVTAPHKVVTVLLPESKGGMKQGQAVLPFCRTGMTVAEVRAACKAAGVSGPVNPSGKTDTFVGSGLRNLQRAGVIRIDEPARLQAAE